MQTTANNEMAHARNKTLPQKLVKSWIFWIIFLGLLYTVPLLRSINRELPPELPVYSELPKYELINEQAKPFGSEQLMGKTYIANFFFTSCPSVCPKLMGKMKVLQKRIRGLREKAVIVSFTVDPKVDTPQVLKKKSEQLKANPLMWHFLTGEQEQLKSLLIDGFKVPMGDKPDVDLYDIAHTEKLVLVDHHGRIRGYYSSDDEGIDQLVTDVGLMVNLGTSFLKEQ